MFIWIGVAVVAAISLAIALHKVVAMRLLGVYYEAEVLQHDGRECFTDFSAFIGTTHKYHPYETWGWERTSEKEKERKIHRCAKKRALYQSKRWVRTELSDWFDRTSTKAEERKEASINKVLEPLRGQMQAKLEDKRRVETIVQELRSEPLLTDQQKFDLVYAHFVDTAHETK